ncbi:M56 family metallopeptidase [Flavobacterium sp. MC2016-06]|uniref:M56 family metallopeptidase n=1 Tax=Flavobacterium sp. MC2016-06 TaxID=2676308 RepID=UPI0012BAB982|nr:M56 family metallopeptidase [Flavobacterium sp. MC2016-06]MBU3859646.1 M56 family metallopeptidase [Flavobacterium sp. MC2016-06]
MIPYILYTALIISVCFIFYKLLLQQETFFHLNRFVLLSCMVLAFILPVLPIPQQFSLRKEAAVTHTPSVKNSVQKNETVQLTASPAKETIAEQTSQHFNLDLAVQWLVYLYWFGVIIFALNFLMQAVILLYRGYTTSVIQDGKFRIVEITGDKAPCSFANTIFINPEKYEWETYNQILLHEKIHIEQKHTIDLLLAEIVLVFQWFNPFAWQWRKALEINLEFLTDDKMLQQDTVERESYQFSLLKVAAPQFPLSLTTNYNQSLLKKRIIMMNSKKSNVHTAWKYFFLLPVLVLFACLFNQPTAQAQALSLNEKTTEPKEQSNIQNGMDTEGDWFATIEGNTVSIQFKSGKNSNSSSNFQLSEFSTLPRDKQGEFSLTREAGTMNFIGKFEGNKGMGTYKFTANKNFTKEMAKEGVTIAEDDDFMAFFMINIKNSYVKMLKKNGYKDIDKDQLIPLAALNVDDAYIASIKQSGIENFDLEDLVPFKSMNIDKAFIDEIRQAGYKNVTADNLIALKSQNIDGKYITDFRNATNGSNDDKTEEDIIAFKSLNIDKEFIDSFKALGYNNLSNSDLTAMKSLNITPKFVSEFEKLGYKNIKAGDLLALKSLNITPELIKQYKDLGFNNLELDDVFGAKSIGASPAFIKSMREKGHNFNSIDKYVELKALAHN